jgi:serine protease AprX
VQISIRISIGFAFAAVVLVLLFSGAASAGINISNVSVSPTTAYKDTTIEIAADVTDRDRGVVELEDVATVEVIADAEGPTISNITVTQDSTIPGTRVKIYANVSDPSGLGMVWAEIKLQGYSRNIPMVRSEGYYTATWHTYFVDPGTYSIVITARDKKGNEKKVENAAAVKINNPLDKNDNKIEDSLEWIPGDKSKSIDIIVMHDEKYSSNRYAPFGEVKASFGILNGCAIRTSAVNLAAITNLSGVKMVYEDKKVHTFLDSALVEIKANEVVAGTGKRIRGDGVTIAVIDTGIDANHECLDDLDDDPSTDDPKVIAFKDFVNGRDECYDDNGHGTHCAAIAAGTGGGSKYVGVAPGAELVGVKALDSRGSGYISDVISGIEWCVQEKEKYNIKVISLSLGAGINSDGSTPLEETCDTAVDAGLVMCVAAGNIGPGDDTVGIPGCAKKVITVGAVDDNGKVASFSSRGNTSDERLKPDICAVGVHVTAAKANSDQGYTTLSGTSMATPEVAGAVALLFECNSSLSPPEIKMILIETAEDKGRTCPDKTYGYGALDVESAVNMVLSKSGHGTSGKNKSVVTTSNTSNENVTVTVTPASGSKGEGIKISAKIPIYPRPMFATAYVHLHREEEKEGEEKVSKVMLTDFDMDGAYNGTWNAYSAEPGTYYIDITTRSMKGEKEEFKNAATVEILGSSTSTWKPKWYL